MSMQKIVPLAIALFFLLGCAKATKEKILIVTSNQHTYGSTNKNTSNHFSEIVVAYDMFKNAGYKVDFVSPNGGAIPIGYLKTSDSIQKYYLYDNVLMNLLKNTHKPNQVDALKYKAIYYSGGGTAMFGVPENIEIQNISRQIYESNGIISTVCHGTAGIVHLKMSDGNYIYKNKKINGFPDAFENKTAEYYKTFPFSIEKIIKKNGGKFQYSEKGWDSYYLVDGRLITGQDPTATKLVAQKVIQMLQKIN